MHKLTEEEVKEIQLEILNEFADFCEKNNLEYFLIYGTLLGAIRHKGYIPWDDDIDIAIKRSDYIRLIKEFNNHSKDYKFISYELDKKFPYTFGKIMKKGTLVIEDSDFQYKDLGINIDVFPIDKFSENEQIRKETMKKISFYRKVLEIKGSNNESIKNNFMLKHKTIFAKIIFKVYSVKGIIKKIIKLATKANNEDSKLAGIKVWGYGEKEIMPLEWYSKFIKTNFEGALYKIPANYDEILSQIYGNYMRLPKKEDQITHHSYEAYLIKGEK